MIDTQKLIEYIERAPFPEAEKKRLITLACVADETHKHHIYTLVKTFTDRIEAKRAGKIPAETAKRFFLKVKEFRKTIREKGEELYRQAENTQLASMEAQLTVF